jgi:ABC-type sugar transport system permease subunit/outer membrane protein assembly factor BamB
MVRTTCGNRGQPTIRRGALCAAILCSTLFLVAAAGSLILTRLGGTFRQAAFAAAYTNDQILYSTDGTHAYLGTYKNEVVALDEQRDAIWKAQTGGAVDALCMDEAGGRLFAGCQDRSVWAFDLQTGDVLLSLTVDGRVTDLDYSAADDRLLVLASVNNSKQHLLQYNAGTGEPLGMVEIRYQIGGAKYMPDGQSIVYGDKRGNLALVDLAGETLSSEKTKHEITDLAVSPGTGTVVLSTFDGLCMAYSPSLEQMLSRQLVGEGRVAGVSPDGAWLGMGTREGDVYLMDAKGEVRASARMDAVVSQVYFGDGRGAAVSVSSGLLEFSTLQLALGGALAWLRRLSFPALLAFGLSAMALGIAAFPASRALVMSFGRSAVRHRVAYLMLAPSFALILLFHYVPIFQAFIYSFSDWSMATRTMREVKFVGFHNYVKMIQEGYFLMGVRNMLLILLVSMAKLMTVPILCAELIFAMRGRLGDGRRYLFRLLLVVPMVVPGVVTTLMWRNIYDPNIGLANELMRALGFAPRSWLGSASTAMGAVLFMGFPWVNPFAFLVFYGGLINIPWDLFEAARVDGSRPRWNFLHIHLPMISPQIKMMVILTFIGAIQDYGGILLLTNGGPGTATYVPGFELYLNATSLGQYGYACAMGVVLFAVILVGSALNLRMRTADVT